jgi:hypothetical protein
VRRVVRRVMRRVGEESGEVSGEVRGEESTPMRGTCMSSRQIRSLQIVGVHIISVFS